MPKKLRELRVDFASLVDEPANKHARITLFKRDETAPVPAEKAGAYCAPKDKDEEGNMKGKKRMADKAEKTADPVETKPADPVVEKVAEPTEKAVEPVAETVSKADYVVLEKRLAEAETIAKQE